MDTENIEMMPEGVPQISGVSKRILFAQGWSQVGHGLWDPKNPKGPFIYYLITCRGEGGQKMPILIIFSTKNMLT